MRVNAHLDTSYQGPPRLFKDAGVVADSLTGIHNARAKCLFVATGAAYARAFRCPHR
jgi:hypothetical protein